MKRNTKKQKTQEEKSLSIEEYGTLVESIDRAASWNAHFLGIEVPVIEFIPFSKEDAYATSNLIYNCKGLYSSYIVLNEDKMRELYEDEELCFATVSLEMRREWQYKMDPHKYMQCKNDKLLALDSSCDAYAWEYFVVRIIFGDKKRKWTFPKLEAYLKPRIYAISLKYDESEMRRFIQESRNF